MITLKLRRTRIASVRLVPHGTPLAGATPGDTLASFAGESLTTFVGDFIFLFS